MINEEIQPMFEFPPPPIFFNIITDRVFSAFTHFNYAWFISLFHQFHLSEKNESYEKESEGCQILTVLLIFSLYMINFFLECWSDSYMHSDSCLK